MSHKPWLSQFNISVHHAARLYCGTDTLTAINPANYLGNDNFYNDCNSHFGYDAWVQAVEQVRAAQQPAISDAEPKETAQTDKNAYIMLDELHMMMTQIEQIVEQAGYHPTLAMLFTSRAATLIDKHLRKESAGVMKQYNDGMVTYQELLRALIEISSRACIRF